MTFALSTYNDGNLGVLRDTTITIKKIENGYIFTLSGNKENKKVKGDKYFERWENFTAQFVYTDLQTGLKEVDGFFELIKKQLKVSKKKA